jgi:hypothetical protein
VTARRSTSRWDRRVGAVLVEIGVPEAVVQEAYAAGPDRFEERLVELGVPSLRLITAQFGAAEAHRAVLEEWDLAPRQRIWPCDYDSD